MSRWTSVVASPVGSDRSPCLPTSPARSPRGMEPLRQCRLRRRIYLSTVMACGLMCFTLYTLSLSCCAVVNSGLDLTRVRVYPGEVVVSADEARYQRDIEDYTEPERPGPGPVPGQGSKDASGYLHFRGKALLEEGDPGYVQQDSAEGQGQRANLHPHRHSHGGREEGREEGGTLSYTDEEGEDFSEDFTSEDTQYYSESAEYINSNTNTNRGYRTRTRKNSISKMQQGGNKVLPQALIIGVKKGGTRALLEFIRIHPDVRAPGPEPHFFDKNYDKGLDWYRNQMPARLDGQITMEKTPSYFITKGVPARISNMSRDIKLIVVVRDPVTRAISDYTQALTKRTDLKPFAQMAFLDNATGVVDTSWGAIRIGVYAKHLEKWLDYFSLSQIHFVNGEKLITDPAGEIAKVQDFLGLKRVINEKHFYFNSTKGFPCLKKPEGSGNPHCLGKTKGRQHPKVDPKVLKRLRDFYRPFNQKFYQMTGVDFGWP